MTPPQPIPNTPPTDTADLFAAILPRLVARTRFAFRKIRCPDTRDDLAAETIALAWRSFVRLAARGKRPEAFAGVLALRASQAALGGRRLAGADPADDVLSPVARVRRGFVVTPLSGCDLPAASTRGRVPDRAAFRIDFPAWYNMLVERDRSVALALAVGWRTAEVASAFRLTAGRVSQLRRELCASWHTFHGEVVR